LEFGLDSAALGAAATLKRSPGGEERRNERLVWLYWILLVIVAAFVLWAIAFVGRKNLSVQEPTGSDIMAVYPSTHA